KTTETYKPLPGGENHVWPRRPRPAVCSSATTTAPSGSVAATSLVDVTVAKRTIRSKRLDFKADVGRRRGVRERADRDGVGAGRRQFGNALERDAAGNLDLRAPRYVRRRGANLRRGHVVDEDRLGAGRKRLVDFGQRLRFDLDREIRTGAARTLDSPPDTA